MASKPKSQTPDADLIDLDALDEQLPDEAPAGPSREEATAPDGTTGIDLLVKWLKGDKDLKPHLLAALRRAGSDGWTLKHPRFGHKQYSVTEAGEIAARAVPPTPVTRR